MSLGASGLQAARVLAAVKQAAWAAGGRSGQQRQAAQAGSSAGSTSVHHPEL
jgi:hypothetical protein|eukprot:COSAG01_NODE_5311_length_4339_cov_1947.262376_4_plen_52_part_00